MRHKLAFAALVLASLPLAREGLAQGATVYTHGACTTARAGAAVADPCADGSAVFYNPAALAVQPGAVSLGATVIAPSARFTFDDSAMTTEMSEGPAFVPHLFAGYTFAPGFAFGLGLWAPYGLGTEWPITFEGRFTGYDNHLRSIYLQPTAAFQVVPDRLAVGVGVDLIRAEVRIRRRLDAADLPVPMQPFTFGRSTGPDGLSLAVPVGTDFADADLHVDTSGAAAFHIGLWAGLREDSSLGARYLHSARLTLDGSADFEPVPTGLVLPPGNPFGLPPGTPLDAILAPLFAEGGPLIDQALATSITLPAQLVVGWRYSPDPRFSLLADYQWTGWSEFDRAVLRFSIAPVDTLHLGWRNTHDWRLGGDFQVRTGLLARGGLAYNTAATPDNGVTPLLPEARRFTFTTGADYRIGSRFQLAAALEYATQADRRGRVRPAERADALATEVNVGEYSGHAWLGAMTLTYTFGDRATPAVATPPH